MSQADQTPFAIGEDCDDVQRVIVDVAQADRHKAGITPQSMTETIATLIRKDLIERIESPEHRRILMTRLTEAGEALLERCETAVDALEERLLMGIPASDLAIVRKALRVIAKAR